MKVVGQELPRVEVLEKVTGQSVFGADVRLGSPFLFGKVLRSPHAHARIKKIDTKRAERLKGLARRTSAPNTDWPVTFSKTSTRCNP